MTMTMAATIAAKPISDRPLDKVEQWMVKRNLLDYVPKEGAEAVVARLRGQGYERVASAVESAAATRPPGKRGCELVTGDVVHCGGECRTITGFDEHPGLREHTARVLRSGEYGITLFDNDMFYMLSNGSWVSSHLWWHREHSGK